MDFKPEEIDNFIERLESIIELYRNEDWMLGICLKLGSNHQRILHNHQPLSCIYSSFVNRQYWWPRGLVKPRLRYLNNLVKYLRMPNGIRRKLFWVYITLFS